MELTIYQLDAFTDRVFQGNPAAIVPLDAWLPDDLMQSIAMENNLSETAFYVPMDGGFHLRWFTPVAEVDLCGHATLACAALLFEHMAFADETIRFFTRSGWLSVRRSGRQFEMDFPSQPASECVAPPQLKAAFNVQPVFVGRSDDYLVVVESEAQVRELTPDLRLLMELEGRGCLVTAPGDEVDFVSRCFFPSYGIDEDPVTGSAHCTLAPYWADRLGKSSLTARQISARGGQLSCEVVDDRVNLRGTATLYLKGTIWV